MTLAYIFSGFAVGLLVGLTGVGGGSLMTPILTLWFGVPPAVAVGTDLAFASLAVAHCGRVAVSNPRATLAERASRKASTWLQA